MTTKTKTAKKATKTAKPAATKTTPKLDAKKMCQVGAELAVLAKSG